MLNVEPLPALTIKFWVFAVTASVPPIGPVLVSATEFAATLKGLRNAPVPIPCALMLRLPACEISSAVVSFSALTAPPVALSVIAPLPADTRLPTVIPNGPLTVTASLPASTLTSVTVPVIPPGQKDPVNAPPAQKNDCF